MPTTSWSVASGWGTLFSTSTDALLTAAVSSCRQTNKLSRSDDAGSGSIGSLGPYMHRAHRS